MEIKILSFTINNNSERNNGSVQTLPLVTDVNNNTIDFIDNIVSNVNVLPKLKVFKLGDHIERSVKVNESFGFVLEVEVVISEKHKKIITVNGYTDTYKENITLEDLYNLNFKINNYTSVTYYKASNGKYFPNNKVIQSHTVFKSDTEERNFTEPHFNVMTLLDIYSNIYIGNSQLNINVDHVPTYELSTINIDKNLLEHLKHVYTHRNFGTINDSSSDKIRALCEVSIPEPIMVNQFMLCLFKITGEPRPVEFKLQNLFTMDNDFKLENITIKNNEIKNSEFNYLVDPRYLKLALDSYFSLKCYLIYNMMDKAELSFGDNEDIIVNNASYKNVKNEKNGLSNMLSYIIIPNLNKYDIENFNIDINIDINNITSIKVKIDDEIKEFTFESFKDNEISFNKVSDNTFNIITDDIANIIDECL